MNNAIHAGIAVPGWTLCGKIGELASLGADPTCTQCLRLVPKRITATLQETASAGETLKLAPLAAALLLERVDPATLALDAGRHEAERMVLDARDTDAQDEMEFWKDEFAEATDRYDKAVADVARKRLREAANNARSVSLSPHECGALAAIIKAEWASTNMKAVAQRLFPGRAV